MTMSCTGILTAFSSLSLRSFRYAARNISTNVDPLCFRVSNTLLGEPLKRKKRIDPAIVRQRDERRKRKLEKQIRRLEKNAKQLKPIADMEVPLKLVNEKEKRLRQLPPLTKAVAEQRIHLGKDWTRYKAKQRMTDIQMLDTICFSQQKALDELRVESEELYQAAIQIDAEFLPLTITGPKNTPPIKEYDSPDGEYIDITKKFDGE